MRYARNHPACFAGRKEQYEKAVYQVALTWLTLLVDATSRTLVLLRNFTYISFFCQSSLLEKIHEMTDRKIKETKEGKQK